MNPVTRFINWLDDFFAPLAELSKDENFRGELLASAGAKPKEDPASKENIKKKFQFLLDILTKLKEKLGLDKSDVPKVSNIVAFGMIAAELVAVGKTIYEILEECTFDGTDGSETEVGLAFFNAQRAILAFLTLNAFKRKLPEASAAAEAIGILYDESNEVRRAFDMILFWIMKSFSQVESLGINVDAFRPNGDLKMDDQYRITQSIFLWLSVSFQLYVKKLLAPAGEFLFYFGHELDPVKDQFPNAGIIANRTLQAYFVPGDYTHREDGIDAHGFPETFKAALFLSFTTIPVHNLENGKKKIIGYQYLMGVQGNSNALTYENEQLEFSLPQTFSGNFIWGHETPLDFFGGGVTDIPAGTNLPPFVQLKYKNRKPATTDPEVIENGISLGDITLAISPRKTADNKIDLEFSLQLQEFGLSVSGKGRDGFLQKILPESASANLKLNLKFIYSALSNSFRVEGLENSNGFLFDFSVDKKIFGALTIPTFYVGVKPLVDEEKKLSGISLESSALMTFQLGPFAMTADRLGLQARFNLPRENESKSGWDFDVALKPPTGVGFHVDASVVKGGGFLSIDPENHQYYGAGELSIEFEGDEENFCLSLKVIAVILTQMPDGSKGFSFLVMASIEFQPGIETPIGFKITGLGVMIAINRTMNIDEFQVAVRGNRFDSILFPTNPAANAPTIVKSMNALFPAARDRYVFAFMARIAWGAKNFVDIKLGLLLEVPSPVTLALIGVVKVTLKKKDKQILFLQMDFLVALNFQRKLLIIDARIYKSKLLMFELNGDIYLRYRWDNEPIFLVALGGWHPDFAVPAGLNLPAKPARITLSLIENDKLSLIISLYIAVTSNTFQAGFAVAFMLKWSKFKLEAGLALDALFRDINDFIVKFEGKLKISWGSSTLAGVTVKGDFSGTSPWRIKGKATFEIWIFDYDVDFDKSSGEELAGGVGTVDPLTLIIEAIHDRRNWQSALASGVANHITLRNSDKDDATGGGSGPDVLSADPLSKLEVVQQVTPLGIRIDKLGQDRVTNFRKFDLTASVAAGQSLQTNNVDEFFAPAMFLDLQDDEKLSRKSYERMKAGQSFSDVDSVTCGAVQVTPFEYDEFLHDTLAPPVAPAKGGIAENVFQQWVANGSIARSAEGRRHFAKKQAEARRPQMQDEEFVVIDSTKGTPLENIIPQKAMANAYYELWKLKQTNPLQKFNVVRKSELVP